MKDLLMIGLFLFAWIALNRWILPAMGIDTCMSGACCGDSCRTPVSRPVASAPEEGEQEEESRGEVLRDGVSTQR
jgi:hypothetical protein